MLELLVWYIAVPLAVVAIVCDIIALIYMIVRIVTYGKQTNESKYKTAVERERGFNRYCSLHHGCIGCPINEGGSEVHCVLKWLELEAEEK